MLSLFSHIIKYIRVFAVIAYALLLLIHFVLKDHFHFLQVIFYATPLPLLIITGGFIVFLFLFNPRTFFIDALAFLIILTGVWFKNSYIFSASQEVPLGATSVMFWNAADGHDLPVRVLLESIEKNDPDVIGLVEATNATSNDLKKLADAFPAYKFKILAGGMLLGVKGEINATSYYGQPHSYDINIINVSIKSGTFTLAVTDTFQDPSMNKGETLRAVLDIARDNTVDVFMGDFNTPYESIHFNPYKKQFLNLRNFGKGFTATWLFGYPILEIDQIYLNKKLHPLQLQKLHYKASDHAMLIGYFKN